MTEFDPDEFRKQLEEIRGHAEEIGAPRGGHAYNPKSAQARQWKDEVVDPLRGLTSLSGPLLTTAREIELLPENTGTSVMSVKRWRQQIESSRDREMCLFLLQLINDRDVEFWARYHAYDDVDQFIQDVDAGDVGSGSEENVVRTRRWLQEQDVPAAMPPRQQGLQRWSRA